MTEPIRITPEFAVTRSLTAADFGRAASTGFRTIISFLPDGESAHHLPATKARELCQAEGLSFAHIPARKYELFTEDVISRARQALSGAESPVLAYCSSGQRAAIVWAAARATAEPVDSILGALAKAGLDLSFIRDDLDAQADRSRWLAPSAHPEAIEQDCSATA